MAEQSEALKKWFSRYNLISPVGEGGMGQVYLAEDRWDNDARVVIKQTKIADKTAEERQLLVKVFLREADTLSKLKHRGIVKLTDVFSSDDEPDYMFLVMEYVPGQNLDRIVASEGPLSSETVIRIAIQCCDVLDYLHGLQPPIIYRDLKPSNLILRPDGLVVFVDFGIARDFEPKGPSTRVVTSGYAPPEQYFGKPEPRGDIYSLGATMHHLLTGVRPRPLTPCSPASILPSVLKDLDALIRQMTSHEIDQRPPSASAVQFELFKQYKHFHPEFEIPDPGLQISQWDQESEMTDFTDRVKNGETAERHRPTLLDKFKQWVDAWTGRR